MKLIRHIGSLAFVLGLFTSIFVGLPWYVIVSDDPVIPWWLRTAIFCLLGGILVVLLTVALEQTGKKGPKMSSQSTAPDQDILLMSSTASTEPLTMPGSTEVTDISPPMSSGGSTATYCGDKAAIACEVAMLFEQMI